jgi:hypothetical protein
MNSITNQIVLVLTVQAAQEKVMTLNLHLQVLFHMKFVLSLRNKSLSA